ncbi:hypothetical protein PVK06_030449 [Gossypium arboreum]|uniref:Uncharacterized protein n=1 Tax=Gossypium arboreum TaxID=29729 RepID=A0ABR0NQP5_GOSAR|nr:hypothetical protein PVK06_030449 [Gossypium arboreum]
MGSRILPARNISKDGDGIVRADVPFRRAESKYSAEQVVGIIFKLFLSKSSFLKGKLEPLKGVMDS